MSNLHCENAFLEQVRYLPASNSAKENDKTYKYNDTYLAMNFRLSSNFDSIAFLYKSTTF